MLMPEIPNNHALAVMLLTIFALWLFRKDSIPLETSSLVILVILAVGFALLPFHQNGISLEAGDFFSGFGHEAMIAVCGLMIAGQGLVRTGALEPIGRQLAKLWRISPMFLLLISLGIAAVFSSFFNIVVDIQHHKVACGVHQHYIFQWIQFWRETAYVPLSNRSFLSHQRAR